MQTVVHTQHSAYPAALTCRTGASLRLQFPKEDLGFVYSSQGAATASCSTPTTSPTATNSSIGTSARSSTPAVSASATRAAARGQPYVPECVVGGRLPHCWLELLQAPAPAAPVSGQQQQDAQDKAGAVDGHCVVSPPCPVSTLNLPSLPWALGRMLLLLDCTRTAACSAGSGMQDTWQQAMAWAHAGNKLAAQGVPFVVVVLIARSSDTDPVTAGGVIAHLPSQAVHVQEISVGAWQHASRLGPGHAVLVRPDGHVAWLGSIEAGAGAGMPAGGQDKAGHALRAVLSQLHMCLPG